MNLDEKVFLFDMDGTLTPPRKQIESFMITALRKLSKFGKIGIVTGSDYDYVMQQMMAAFGTGGVPVDKIDILPCNGTKKYSSTPSRKFMLESEVNMIDEIGEESYKKIIKFCLESQAKIIDQFPELSYTGTFLQYRGSLLNWCPIGRSADHDQREMLVKVDHEKKFRDSYANNLRKELEKEGIAVTVALGGSTSLDIYPNGWDKTYALKHYDKKEIYFVGDRCEEGGNDWHIYEKLKSTGRAYNVESTKDTEAIIERLIC